MKKIGLMGFGRFGRLLYDQLKTSVDIQVHDPEKAKDYANLAVPFVDIGEICKNELIILAIPVSQIEKVCDEIKPYLTEQSIIMDVCAVKTYPSRIMLKKFNSSFQ